MKLTKPFEEAGKFIGRVQQSSDKVKNFWIVVFSGISLAIVVGLWSVYGYSNPRTVRNSSDVRVVETITEIPALEITEEEPTKEGFTASLWDTVTFFKKRLGVEKRVAIQGTKANFIYEDLEEIAPVTLP